MCGENPPKGTTLLLEKASRFCWRRHYASDISKLAFPDTCINMARLFAFKTHKADCSRRTQGGVVGYVGLVFDPSHSGNDLAEVPSLFSKKDVNTNIFKYLNYFTYIHTYIHIYGTALPAPPPPHQWSWVRQVPPPRGCGPVVGLWWFRVGLELV